MQNTPSGIAQLRKSSENAVSNTEPMNIDDFIFSENAATPAGISSPLPPSAAAAAPATSRAQDQHSSHTLASAIPIKSRRDMGQQQQQQQQHQHDQQQQQLQHPHPPFVPQSVPVTAHQPNHSGNEFHYVQRHLRKTSIDERRVSTSFSYLKFIILTSHASYHARAPFESPTPTSSIPSAGPPRTLVVAHLPSQ